jgi:transposase InsO family protein
MVGSRTVCFHGAPKRIVSDRETQFISKFWERLHKTLDTRLNISSAYHSHTHGQIERVNQILLEYAKSLCSIVWKELE